MWQESYRIGNPHVDMQHKKLFGMVDELSQILHSDESEAMKKDKCQEAIVFMKAYVIMHFRDEEEFQKSLHHDRFEIHHQIHVDFTEEIGHYEELLVKTNFDLETVKAFAIRLEEWLVEHVTGEDQLIKKSM